MVVRTFVVFVAVSALCVAGCDGGRGGGHGDGGTGVSKAPAGPDVDSDGDGYTPNQGDCDDSTALVGPNSIEVANNGVDDDCDGQSDNVPTCDTATAGMKTSDALATSIGICANKFRTGTKFNGPSKAEARNTVAALGVVKALDGATMAYISSGLATTDPTYRPQSGTSFDETANPTMFPYLKLKLNSTACGVDNPTDLYDYTELEVDLTVPFNANSFSFQSQFFSAEYPEFVCMGYNDRFLVVLDDGANPLQVEYDMSMNPITVNNGFFTVCQNWTTAQTKHCTKGITDIMGTGYDTSDGSVPIGGSTGWLTTTVPVTPGDHVKLRFIIFDEGDWIYDSAALIDNFQWLTGMVSAPVTVQ